jgi:hypothetical protein
MTAQRNFLGIPVEGEITRPERRSRQRPLEEFAPLLQAVLDSELVTEFGWAQYTPYFMDGDPCIFGASTVWVRTTSDTGGTGTFGDYDDDMYTLEVLQSGGHPTLGLARWNGVTRAYDEVERSPEITGLSRQCTELAKAIDGGSFDDVLLDAFGDHAEITVRRDGITIASYSHD